MLQPIPGSRPDQGDPQHTSCSQVYGRSRTRCSLLGGQRVTEMPVPRRLLGTVACWPGPRGALANPPRRRWGASVFVGTREPRGGGRAQLRTLLLGTPALERGGVQSPASRRRPRSRGGTKPRGTHAQLASAAPRHRGSPSVPAEGAQRVGWSWRLCQRTPESGRTAPSLWCPQGPTFSQDLEEPRSSVSVFFCSLQMRFSTDPAQNRHPAPCPPCARRWPMHVLVSQAPPVRAMDARD